jgi:hypothetical protein
MRVLAVSFALFCAMLITGCKAKIPDGIFTCKSSVDCPNGQFCHVSDGSCHTQREIVSVAGVGRGRDASLEGGGDAGDNGSTGGKSGGGDGANAGTGGSNAGTGDASTGSGGSGNLRPCVLGSSTVGNCVLQ